MIRLRGSKTWSGFPVLACIWGKGSFLVVRYICNYSRIHHAHFLAYVIWICMYYDIKEAAILIRSEYVHLVYFQPFLPRKTTFMTSCLHSCTANSIGKGVYSERKEFAPGGSKFFPLRVGSLFRRQTENNLKESLPPLTPSVSTFSLNKDYLQ